MHHFGTVFGDTPLLVLLAHHEARYVLQEHQGNVTLAAQLDEMGSF